MFEPGQDPSYSRAPEHSGWLTGISMLVAIVICVAAFIWLFLQIDPYLSDFISGDEPTPTMIETPAVTQTPVATPFVP
jgi:hypothetical protein